MAETSFEVKYDGEALRDGRMPVRDLAPALLALGEVFREASAELYPNLPAPSLNVQATERGSFDVHLVLAADGVWEQVVNMLTAKGPTALTNLFGLVIDGTVVGAGFYKLAQIINNRKIKREEAADSPDRMRIILEDDTVIEAPAGTVRLYKNPGVRRAARDSLAPLKHPEVKSLKFQPTTPEVTPVTVEADKVDAFDLPTSTDDDELVDDTHEAVVSVVKADFADGRWRVNDGTATFGVEMEDEGFKDQIEHGEPFRKGDLLRARIRTIQSTRDGKLQNEHRLVEVIDHIKSGEQLQIGSQTDPGDEKGS